MSERSCYNTQNHETISVPYSIPLFQDELLKIGGARGRPADTLTPEQLESIVNLRLSEAKKSTDALKSSESPLALGERMAAGDNFVRADEFAIDESNVSVFARRDFALKLWPGLAEERQ